MIGRAFGSLGAPDEPDRVAGPAGRVGVLGDLDYLPPLIDEAPQSFELGVVTPSSHPNPLPSDPSDPCSLQVRTMERFEPGTYWVRTQSVKASAAATLESLPADIGRRRA
jgi:hypothetical protein